MTQRQAVQPRAPAVPHQSRSTYAWHRRCVRGGYLPDTLLLGTAHHRTRWTAALRDGRAPRADGAPCASAGAVLPRRRLQRRLQRQLRRQQQSVRRKAILSLTQRQQLNARSAPTGLQARRQQHSWAAWREMRLGTRVEHRLGVLPASSTVTQVPWALSRNVLALGF